MDYEGDFIATAKEIAAQCWNKRASEEHTLEDGTKIQGWNVGAPWSTDYNIEKSSPGLTWWRESWGNSYRILAKDGTFYEYFFSAVDEKDKEPERSTSVRPISCSRFVGSKGKPFSEAKAQLERLPYL